MKSLQNTFRYIDQHLRTQCTNEKIKSLLWSIASLGLTASLLLSHNAWSTDRTFPLSPVIPGFVAPETVQSGLFFLTVFTLLAGLLVKRFRPHLTSIALFAILTLVLLDITRLQPWVLHYFAVLLLFGVWIPQKEIMTVRILDAARLIIGGIYFWSGLQKINVRFFTEVFPWFTEVLWRPLGDVGISLFLSIGLLVPFIEILFAIGLFTKRARFISIIAATLMLLLVLLSIGPIGQGWNSTVWPWNIAIYFMVFILFFNLQTSFVAFIKRQRHNVLAWAVICVFWIMPAGNLFGITDHYLSWSLYSGRVPGATLVGDPALLQTISTTANENELTFQSWIMTDINIVNYPEERVYIDVFEKICTEDIYKDLQLKISSPHLFYSNIKDEVFISCPE